jgi:hypothetical protein
MAMLTMYNSFSNVTESIGNNKLTIHWLDGPSHTPVEITLVDDSYDSVNFYTAGRPKSHKYLFSA